MIAGGIGITPLRALLEALPADHGEMTLLYRVSTPADIVFGDELAALARDRGIRLHYLVGRRGSSAMPEDPLEPRPLLTLVPDITERDVYLCAPTPMMHTVEATLKTLRVPGAQIHAERFAY